MSPLSLESITKAEECMQHELLQWMMGSMDMAALINHSLLEAP
jgi:hypothetical protein